jgi:hypothetical protein
VQKDTDDVTVFFALLGSSDTKAACKTLMKLTTGLCSWIYLAEDRPDRAWGLFEIPSKACGEVCLHSRQ